MQSTHAISLKFVFFGTDEFAVIVLEELKKTGFVPSLVVTLPDHPVGRGLKLTPPPIKIWAQKNNVEFAQPQKLDGSVIYKLRSTNCELFVVASYGKIIPKEILNIPKLGSLNVHPSILPLYRGASPIQSQILEGAKKSGVTIMLMDEKIDHGPIVAQKTLPFSIFNFQFSKLRDELAPFGGQLLAETIPKWVRGEITPKEQDHSKATYTKMIRKEDGLIDLHDAPELNYRKFLAYTPWPGTYFFVGDKRVKITDAELVRSGLHGRRPDLESACDEESYDIRFVIKKVIPEGKREIAYEQFTRAIEK